MNSDRILSVSFSKIQEDFRQKVWRQSRSEGMLHNVDVTFTMFERFCQDSYKKSSSRVITKLKSDILKAHRQGKSTKKLYLFLDNFAQWLCEYKPKKKSGLAPTTIRGYFSEIIQFLRYNEILIDNNMLKQFVSLPKKLKELPQPITIDEINILVINADEIRSAMYLTLVSSGIRVGEALQLRKKDFEMKFDPARIVLPARITKSRQGRYSFISREAKLKLIPILVSLEDDDLVFTNSNGVMRAELTEELYFTRLRKKVGLTEMESSGLKHKITIHKFRKFFATKAERKLGIQVSGALLGHSPYMKTYYEYEVSQLANLYSDLEAELTISPEHRQKLIIENQQKEISDLKRSELEIQRLKSQQVDDKKQVLDMISKLVDDPEKFKEILKKSK